MVSGTRQPVGNSIGKKAHLNPKNKRKLTVFESPKSPRALLAIEYSLSLCGLPFLSTPSGITPTD